MSATTECPECGCTPMGEGCYHICPNSVAYYTPEQEREDDAHYHDDYNREAYGDTAECHDYADAMEHGAGGGDPDDGW